MTSPRWAYERAVLASKLPASARLVLLALAVVADWPCGKTPERFTPSLSTLADLTGLSRRTVMDHLNIAEADGWVERYRPLVEKARADKERTRYRLMVDKASATVALARAGDALELGQEMPQARAPVAHKPEPLQNITRTGSLASPTAPPDEPAPTKAKKGSRIPEPFVVTDAMKTWARQETPLVVVAIETAVFIDYWIAQPGQRGVKLNWESTWRNWMRKAQKDAERDHKRSQPRELPPSNAPKRIPVGDACPRGHQGELARNCRVCASERKAGIPNPRRQAQPPEDLWSDDWDQT